MTVVDDGLTPEALVEIERVKRLKYTYLRCVDQKLYDELADILTENVTASYGGGAHTFAGRDDILAFLREAMGADTFHSTHHCHHPEIEFKSRHDATGRWALEDTVIETSWGVTIRGAGVYDDRYVKIDGRWLIAHTGYKRIWEEIEPRASTDGLKLTASWWSTAGRSELA